jgi:Na+-driven multidrug efflux pump
MPTASKTTHRRVLAIAIPIMLSNVSQPLIGVVDTAVIGRLPEPYYIGAIAIASLVFDYLYWGFGFLRLGTSGLTAQAFGADDEREVVSVPGRSFIVAIGCGALLIIVGPFIEQVIFRLIEGSAEVEENAAIYFRIRIWSAPFALINFVMLGWFIGQGRAKMALDLQRGAGPHRSPVGQQQGGRRRVYLPWVALSSILGVVCFQLDGIFTGATRTQNMRNMMIVSIAIYLAVWWVATKALGNHGLWLALNAFFVIRAITLGVRLPALERASFTASR